MSCLTIDTETLLINFFGSPEYKKAGLDKVDLNIIEKCAIVLANNLPGYTFYDITKKSIQKVVKKHKGFILDGNTIYYKGKKLDRHKYNHIYTDKISNEIEAIIDSFFKYRIFEKPVVKFVDIK